MIHLIPSTSAHGFGRALFLGLLAFTGTPLLAQRIPLEPFAPSPNAVPSPAPASPAGVQHGAQEPVTHRQIGEAMGPFMTPIHHDDPDFAPMDEVKDEEGLVVDLIPKGNPYMLSFLGGDFTPEPGLDPRMAERASRDPGGHSFGYVMIQGRFTDPAKRRMLEERSVQLLSVHTWQSHLARIPNAWLQEVASLPFVRWVGYALPEQKLEPALARSLAEATPEQRFRIDVSVFASDLHDGSRVVTLGAEDNSDERQHHGTLQVVIPEGPFHRALEAAGLEYEFYVDIDNVFVFRGHATPEQILRIRDLDFVSYVEETQRHQPFHGESQAMFNNDRVRGSYGGGQITVGVIDTGLESQAGTRHQDFGPKFLVGWSTVTGQSPFIDGFGHGTHVTGTIAGEGIAQARFRGTAPSIGRTATSRIFVGRYFDNAGVAQGNVETHYQAMRSDYSSGGQTSRRPQVINNSWGIKSSSLYSGTESGARIVDGYVYTNLQTYVFASGNSGAGTTSPGSAKNVLTVGSVTDWWDNTTRAGRRSDFSRSGTWDARRKPEVMAPGDVITSTSNWSTTGYLTRNGTSMAAPHITGAVAQLIEHYPSLGYRPQNMVAELCATADWLGNPGSSSGWFGDTGYGLINAYKLHWSTTRHGGWSGYSNSELTASGQGQYWDIGTVPADVEHVKVVMSWIEPAAGSGASQARVNDIRMWLDIAPFTAGTNTGEFSTSSGTSNLISISSLRTAANGFCAAVRGKQLRIKVHGQSISTRARIGMAIAWQRKPPTSVAPVLTSSFSRAIVRPSSTLAFTGSLAANANGPEFTNARLFPTLPGGFSLQGMTRTMADGVATSFTSPNGQLRRNGTIPIGEGFTVGQGVLRELTFNLIAPATSNSYILTVTAHTDPGTRTLLSNRTLCVDGLAPNPVANLRSNSHTVGTWSNITNLAMAWNTPTDVGCAGIKGLAYSVTSGSTGTPTTMNITGAATTRTVALGSSGSGQYFNIRAVDNVDYFSPGATSSGPYYIDLTTPSTPSVTIAGGAAYTSNLSVSVMALSSDTYSGPYQMRYSSDNSTWSGWYTYTTSARTIDLSANGGNANEGVKTLYVQVRDQAGNVSPSGSGTIEYMRLPVFSAATIATLENVTDGYYRFTGINFVGITSVRFGAATLTSTLADDWYQGYFRVLSDTVLYVYPPQGMVADNYMVIPVKPAGMGAGLSVAVTYPTARRLHGPSQIKGGKLFDLLCHRGTMPAFTLSLLTLSTDPSPSVFPGLISLSHGGLFGPTFLVWPIWITHNGTTGVARWTMNAPVGMPGARIFFQAAMLDPANPNVVPFRVSERVDVLLY